MSTRACSKPHVDVGKEFRRYCIFSRAVFGSLIRVTQKQVFARTGERDVKQSSLFLRVPFGACKVVRAHGRKEPLFETDDEYRVELQSLSRMHGHQHSSALVRVHGELVLLAL